jgi:hypothetical protein
MDRKPNVVEPFNRLVRHVDGEVSCLVGIVVLAADVLIDEQTQMRVINLYDRNAFIAEQLDLFS